MKTSLRFNRARSPKSRAGRVPYIAQMEIADCGAACLAMTLSYYGKRVSLATLRDSIGPGRDGIKASTIAKAARLFGLSARGVRLDARAARCLPTATVLFWKSNHFIVFEKATRRGIAIVDPAVGRRVVSEREFDESFSNVAIVLEPGPEFDRHIDSEPRDRRMFRALFLHKRSLLGIVLVSLLLQGMALAVPFATGRLIDTVVGTANYSIFPVLIAGLAAIAIGYFLASLVRTRTLLELRRRLDIRLTSDFVGHMAALPYSFFMTRSQGDLMMRVNSNATVRELTTASAISTFLDGVIAAFYLVIIFWRSVPLGILVGALALLQTGILLYARRPLRTLMTENLRAQAKSQSYLAQLVAGIETLKSAGVEESAVEKWKGLFVEEVDTAVRRGRVSALVEAALSSLRNASPLIILALGVSLVASGELTLGSMLALVALATGLLDPVGRLVITFAQFQMLGSYLERMKDVWSTKPEQALRLPKAPQLTGCIALENVTFRHGPVSPTIVESVSLRINAGQSIALVGPSGCGKSTLVRILIGLCLPTTGQVLFDGVDIRNLDLHTLRSQIGIVPQHPYIFSASIRENIALPQPEASMEQIVRAASLACLDEDIQRMPMGYETMLGDGGSLISGGQRQRIALARALLRRPAVLVLDEATSALDSATEARVMQNLNSTASTKILVAHRLSTIALADEIVVIDTGRIAEAGSHSSLLASCGLYARLVRGQSSLTGLRVDQAIPLHPQSREAVAASGMDLLAPGDPTRGIGELLL